MCKVLWLYPEMHNCFANPLDYALLLKKYLIIEHRVQKLQSKEVIYITYIYIYIYIHTVMTLLESNMRIKCFAIIFDGEVDS